MKRKRREHLGTDPLSRAGAPPALPVVECPVVESHCTMDLQVERLRPDFVPIKHPLAVLWGTPYRILTCLRDKANRKASCKLCLAPTGDRSSIISGIGGPSRERRFPVSAIVNAVAGYSQHENVL